jgi:hypothetical protein
MMAAVKPLTEKDLSALGFLADAVVANPRDVKGLVQIATRSEKVQWKLEPPGPELKKAIVILRDAIASLVDNKGRASLPDIEARARVLMGKDKDELRQAVGLALLWAVQNRTPLQAKAK